MRATLTSLSPCYTRVQPSVERLEYARYVCPAYMRLVSVPAFAFTP